MHPNTQSDHEEVVRWLSRREAYPNRPGSVEHRETHISHVFLAGEDVYKLKKPLQLEFLDYSSVSLREQACRDEVRLNRRLAADIYLGVVPVTRRDDGHLQLGGPGEPIDWLVHMRRLPTDQTLEALHRQGGLRREHLQQLTATLVRFYGEMSPVPISPVDYRESIAAHVAGNRTELLDEPSLSRQEVLRAHNFQLQLLHLKTELFDQRVRQGRIVDGHGDLRPEHICFTQPLAIFDCIEFSADFRRIDVADELAFLAAECDYLGAVEVGPAVLNAYQQQTGDHPPAVLVDFYKSYRACVRAKVSVLRAAQLANEARQAAIAEVKKHLGLADRYAHKWHWPFVVVVGGLSGSGKSTLAKELAASLGAELLRTDVLRDEVAPQGALRYAPQSRLQVYDAMLQRAAGLYRDGISVVLDGTFSHATTLENAAALTGHEGDHFLAIQCVCRPEVARQRIEQRLRAGDDASEARTQTHDQQRAAWTDWPAHLSQLRVDTEQPLPSQLQAVLTKLSLAWQLAAGSTEALPLEPSIDAPGDHVKTGSRES